MKTDELRRTGLILERRGPNGSLTWTVAHGAKSYTVNCSKVMNAADLEQKRRTAVAQIAQYMDTADIDMDSLAAILESRGVLLK